MRVALNADIARRAVSGTVDRHRPRPSSLFQPLGKTPWRSPPDTWAGEIGSLLDQKPEEIGAKDAKEAKTRRKAALDTPTNLTAQATRDISAALTALLADMFALYLKTKNFHWHVSGPHFRDYHLLLDEQGEQIFASTDDIAERVRKIGGTTLRSIGHIARLQRVLDNDADFVAPSDMLAELRDDNKDLTQRMRETHALCDEHGDVATASLLENWIDEAERRTWFLFEAARN